MRSHSTNLEVPFVSVCLLLSVGCSMAFDDGLSAGEDTPRDRPSGRAAGAGGASGEGGRAGAGGLLGAGAGAGGSGGTQVGSAGTAGNAGVSGTAGNAGVSGTAGYAATSGAAGNAGVSGAAGNAGVSGAAGNAGVGGAAGNAGVGGAAGNAGNAGNAGAGGYTYVGAVVPKTCAEAHGYAGCCGPDGKTAYYFNANTGLVNSDTCTELGLVCSWTTDHYGCAATTAVDPTGKLPLRCGGEPVPGACP